MDQDILLPALQAGMVVLSTCYFLNYLWKKSHIKQKIRKRQKVCKDAFHILEEHLQDNGVTKAVQKQILALSLVELVEKLRTGELKSVEVLKAYQAKALEVNGRINCLVEPVAEAEKLASSSDRKKERGLLEGVPISVKENHFIKGYESTAGMSALLGNPSKEDGVIVKVLLHQGAIPFVRTNIPQTMMVFECSNPIYGQTLNPHNVLRGPGGSSGGEAALLAAGGSILGIGSDIGGSIRIPSNMCGVCGLKPTAGRISLDYAEELVKGQMLVRATSGPMAKDVDSLALTMKALLCPLMFQLDPTVPPIPFRSEIYESTRPLRIGYYVHDGYLPCIPAVERGLMETKAALEKRGHTLVRFTPPKVEEMFVDLMTKICLGDTGQSLRGLLNEDVVDGTLTAFHINWRLPRIVQRLLSYLLSFIANDPLPGGFARSFLGVNSVSEWWKTAQKLNEYRQEFLTVWKASDLDAVICPAFPIPAVPNGCCRFVFGATTYTTLYNVVNYPAGAVPVTKVTAVDQVKMKDYPTKRLFEKKIKQFYSADTGGLPVCVQCVALPYQEELVLRLMKEVETAMKKT